MKGLMILMLIATFFYGCSKDDDINKPVENDSFITGKWVTTYKPAEYGDSLNVSLDLSGKDGSFTGHGTIVYGIKSENQSSKYTWEDDANGTYSENEISITLVSSLSGNSYTFTGSADKSACETKFIGKVTLNISPDKIELNDIILTKSK